MYKDIIEARYTNEQQDTILILHTIEDGVVIEEYIQPGTAQHKALEDLGWTKEKIIDATAEFKRNQINAVRESLKFTAKDVYKEELDKVTSELANIRKQILEAQIMHKQKSSKFQREIVQAELLVKQRNEEALKAQSYALKAQSYLNKVEADVPEKIQSLNSFVASSISTNDLQNTILKIAEFISVYNENEEALNIVKEKSAKAKTSKTLLNALKHII